MPAYSQTEILASFYFVTITRWPVSWINSTTSMAITRRAITIPRPSPPTFISSIWGARLCICWSLSGESLLLISSCAYPSFSSLSLTIFVSSTFCILLMSAALSTCESAITSEGAKPASTLGAMPIINIAKTRQHEICFINGIFIFFTSLHFYRLLTFILTFAFSFMFFFSISSLFTKLFVFHLVLFLPFFNFIINYYKVFTLLSHLYYFIRRIFVVF